MMNLPPAAVMRKIAWLWQRPSSSDSVLPSRSSGFAFWCSSSLAGVGFRSWSCCFFVFSWGSPVLKQRGACLSFTPRGGPANRLSERGADPRGMARAQTILRPVGSRSSTNTVLRKMFLFSLLSSVYLPMEPSLARANSRHNSTHRHAVEILK